MSPLRQYLAAHDLTIRQLAALIRGLGQKLSTAYLSQLASGHRRPSWDLAKAIETATEGEVTATALLDFNPDESHGDSESR